MSNSKENPSNSRLDTLKIVLGIFIGAIIGLAIAVPTVNYITVNSYELFGIETKHFASIMLVALFVFFGLMSLIRLSITARKKKKNQVTI